MKITDALLGEHGAFYAQLNYLADAMSHCDSLEQMKYQGALLAAALSTHACMEDNLLFTTLEPYIGTQGPLAMMRYEHQQIDQQLLHQLPQVQDIEQAKDLMKVVIQLARAHFTKEEFILFPLAIRSLPAEKLQELGQQWANHRGVAVN